ncbi:MAG: MauE/DoxX family redox-associated membrane protein [Dehalococcoidales bacterium]|nr:MauE/DoxX family redox-associated membrane protein [Dehalococcoidales bacterium]
MNIILKNKWVVLAFRVILGGIFLAASISKILDRSGFVSTVVGYELIPRTLAEVYGWVIPWVELYIGCSLVLGVLPRVSAAMSIPLVISFAVASSYALEKFPDSICGCFGSFIALSHPVSLTIDGIMFLLALAILVNKNTEFVTIGQWFNRLNPSFRRDKKVRYYTNLLGVMVLAMLSIVLVSYGIESLMLKTATNSWSEERANILSPLAEKVSEQLKEGKPVLLYVFAEGCSSCETAEPIIEELAGDYSATVAYIKIDYYQYSAQVLEMGIKTTPTVWVIIRQNPDGSFTLANRFDGSLEREELRSALDSAVKLLR